MVAEGYKETEIGVIPEDWEVQIFENISELKRGTSFTKKNLVEGDIPVIAGGKEPAYYHNDYNRDGDTITLSGSGANAGYVNFFTTKIFMSDGFTVKGKKNISLTKYLFYFLKNKQEQIYYLQSGGAQPHIYTKNVASIPIPLPPLKEQEKIADILSTADEKIDAIALQIQKAETLKKGLLQKLLSKGIGHSEFKDSELGKIPESWEVIPFLELADKKISHSFTGGPFGSDLKSEHYTKDGVRVIQLQNIGDGSFINKDFVYTSEAKVKALKTCLIYPNDIILAKMAEPVARACIMPNIEEKYLMGSDGIRLHIDKSKYDTHFILHSINFSRFRDIAIARSTGTTRLRIGLTALKKIPIVIPPLQEQKQIAEILSTADEKLEVIRAKKEKYETLKKGLLQKLLSGEVRV